MTSIASDAAIDDGGQLPAANDNCKLMLKDANAAAEEGPRTNNSCLCHCSLCYVLTYVILLLQMLSLGYSVNNRRLSEKGKRNRVKLVETA